MTFEEPYTELAVAADDIAERIRTLHVFAPGTYNEFEELSSIETVDGVPNSDVMVELLMKAHEGVIKTSRAVLQLAPIAGDESSASLVSDRMGVHENTARMPSAMQCAS